MTLTPAQIEANLTPEEWKHYNWLCETENDDGVLIWIEDINALESLAAARIEIGALKDLIESVRWEAVHDTSETQYDRCRFCGYARTHGDVCIADCKAYVLLAEATHDGKCGVCGLLTVNPATERCTECDTDHSIAEVKP